MKKLILTSVGWLANAGQKYEEDRIVSVICEPDEPQDSVLRKAADIAERNFKRLYGDGCEFRFAVPKDTIEDFTVTPTL